MKTVTLLVKVTCNDEACPITIGEGIEDGLDIIDESLDDANCIIKTIEVTEVV